MTSLCHTSQLNPIISKALYSGLACPGKCLFWDLIQPLSEQLDVLDGLSHMGHAELEGQRHYSISQLRLPFAPCSQFGVCFREGGKAISRFMGAINRAWASANSPCLCFWGCAATVVGNYRCVGEDGYWWAVPPLSFLFTHAQHRGCLNSQSHHKVPRV